MDEVRREYVKNSEVTIPLTLNHGEDKDGVFYSLAVDDVEWICTRNKIHAVVLFEMMKDHIMEYMHFEKRW